MASWRVLDTWYFFSSFFSFLFYSFYLQLTYEPPPWPNCAMTATTHTGHKTWKVEMGTRRQGPNDETGFCCLCPWYIFFFSFFLILFTIRTWDTSCVLGLFFFITTSNNGLKTHQNASWDSLPPYLPWRARGARDMSKHVSRSPPFFPTSCKHKAWDASRALFYFFFSFHLHLGLCFLFSLFFFLFSFFYHFILLTTIYRSFFFKYLNFNTWMTWVGHKRARDTSWARYVYSFFYNLISFY